MTVSLNMSGVIASTLSVLLFAGLQVFRAYFQESRLMTILGGFIGSWIFLFLLTAVSNFEMASFGPGFQSNVFPEVFICLIVTVILSAQVHRVCATTSLLFSLVALYYLSNISTKTYQISQPSQPTEKSSKKRK